MANRSSSAIKRRNVRFTPDPGTLAEMQFGSDTHVYGLVLTESAGGFAAVVMTEEKIEVGDTCQARVGNLGWAEAEVRWVKELEPNLLKLGFQYHLNK